MPSRRVTLIALIVCLLLPGSTALARIMDIPPAPPSFVMDQAGIYRRKAEDLRTIEDKLVRFYNEHGIKLYLYTTSAILDESAQSLANRMSIAWGGANLEPPTVVIVADVVESAIVVGSPFEQSGISLESERPPRLTAAELHEAVSKSLVEIDSRRETDKIAYLDAFSSLLIDELDDQASIHTEATEHRTMWKIWGLFVAIGLPILLVAGLAGAWIVRNSRSQRTTYYFPEAHSPTRLGAQFGAGASTTVSFKK